MALGEMRPLVQLPEDQCPTYPRRRYSAAQMRGDGMSVDADIGVSEDRGSTVTVMRRTRYSGTPPATDRSRLVELFARRKPRYELADVLRLTRSSAEEVNAAVEAGELAPDREDELLLFAWEDLVTLALRHWTPRMIVTALGPSAAAVPQLNRLEPITVHLPLYQIRLLHVLAAAERAGFRGRLNASDILERLLLDLASSIDGDAMEEAIPGFRAALQFPS